MSNSALKMKNKLKMKKVEPCFHKDKDPINEAV